MPTVSSEYEYQCSGEIIYGLYWRPTAVIKLKIGYGKYRQYSCCVHVSYMF